ncbi:MAG: MFS transporter [Blastochloris viridis]|uniref:MFS transporter n=1 Tax=Blastochloris viridis TaxID=1079 RepID=A0A6N4R2K8_BLAVI|nr:MAG: MFS transporter [Blastochloris viridis]
MRTSHIHPNLRHLRTHAMLREAGFVIPVLLAFLQLRGVSFAEFMAIQSMFMVVMLLANPLVSPLADKYGRKPMVIFGSVLWTLGHVVMWLGYGWQAFAFAEILLGIGIAAYRPAAEALLYDSLASVGKENRHYRTLTKQTSLQSYAGAVAMFTGGWLFVLHPSAPILASIFANIGMVLVAVKLLEAPFAKPIAHPTYAQMWKQTWVSLSNTRTRWVVIIPGLISGNTITLFWSVQPTWTAAGVSAAVMGTLMTIHFTARGWFASQCPKLVERFGARMCFALCIALVFMGFVSMALLPWWVSFVPFMLGSGLGYMLADTIGNDLLHHNVPSAIRSTAAGGFRLFDRIVGILSMGTASALQPVIGLEATLMVIAVASAILATVALTRLKT